MLIAMPRAETRREITLATTTTLIGPSLTLHIRSIKLHHTLERVAGIPILHGFSDLMAPTPGCGIGDTQLMLELTGRGACGSRGYQKDGPEPVSQRFSCLVEDGMGDEGGLIITLLALIFLPRWDGKGPIIVTAPTPKAIGPLASNQIPEAVTLGAKPPSRKSAMGFELRTQLPPAITSVWESFLSDARTGIRASSSIFNILA